MSKVAKSFICRGCLNPVTSAVRSSVDIGASAKLELVDHRPLNGRCRRCSNKIESVSLIKRPYDH